MKYAVKIDEVTYTVEINELNARPVIAVVDGVKIEVWPQNGLSHETPASQATLQAQQATAILTPVPAAPTGGGPHPTQVRAPIPGVIVAIAVRPADDVSVGQELCTIEAMKMRNAIRSGRAGVIAAVHISVGETVNHNQLLFEFQE